MRATTMHLTPGMYLTPGRWDFSGTGQVSGVGHENWEKLVTSAAERLQAMLDAPQADSDLDLEGTARATEVLLVAAQLYRHTGVPRC